MLFDRVKKQHILQSLRDFEEKGLPAGYGPSSTYDLVYDGKRYPPKAIMAYANNHASGRKIEPYFKGGDNTECFKVLREKGFQVIPKQPEMEKVNVKQEFAKWLLTNAPDSYNYYLGGSTNSIMQRLKEISDFFPQFNFFDVSPETYRKKIREIKFLFSTKERRKHPDFLEYDKQNSNGIPKAVMGKNNYQKFLIEFFDKAQKDKINYWLFQGNPDVFDFKTAIADGSLETFTVSSHKDKIKVGDKVIIWISGDKAGCYALADITSQPAVVEHAPDDKHWIEDKSKDLRVGIYITHNLFNQPILWDKIKSLSQFKDFNAGYQGTNFRATKEEYETLLKMSNEKRFTWVKTHEEIVAYLATNRDNQEHLIQLLKDAGCDVFNDHEPKDNIIDLEVIDPFTFFCYIYKYGDVKRLEILQAIATKLNIHYPDDERGIPSANAQKVWMFPWKYLRKNNEIDKLWDLFYQAKNNSISEELFQEALQIKNVGKTKLTEALFYVDPISFFPINGPSIPYLKEKLGIGTNFSMFSEYQNILEQIRHKSDKPFYQLSYESWLWTNERDNDLIDFKASINKYNNDELEFYFKHLDDIVSHLDLAQGDKRVVYSCTGLFLNLNIGQRIAWRLDPRPGKKYHIMLDEFINENSGAFDGEPLHYYHIFNNQVELDPIRGSSFDAYKVELERTTKSGYKRHNNKYFERAVFDKVYRNQFFKTEQMENNIDNKVLNTILFGPPGTGKTYNTINEALKIVDPEFYNENVNNRKELNRRFKELLIKKWDETKGQIAFCTFHQSFSYEDFVEGIKPKVNNNKDVFYKIENGVFKNICELADSNLSTLKVKNEGKLSWDENEFNHSSFYKLSLGNSQISEDSEIYEYCRDHNYIAVGFGDETDFKGLSESEIKEKLEEAGYKDTSAQMLNYFIHYLKVDNYVLISNGNQYVRAFGKVVGDYEYIPNAPIRYNHFREVEWIFVDENIPIEEIYEVGLSQRTIYKIDENKLRQEFFVNQGQIHEGNETTEKDYVLIIDEINRGNVSSIFGELITLIETDKRAGKPEELEVILPYSKQPFKVPHNVHIIGTMNTADKSIEALDTALRRRFSFTEMPPKPKLIETESMSGQVNGVVDGINLKQLLVKINTRIEKLIDKDHIIGHSYFLKVNNKSSLIHCFKNEVIPLLEEYFYGDYGKIGLVLGNSFITKDETDDFEFAEFDGYDADVSSDLKERSVYKIAKTKDWDFKTI